MSRLQRFLARFDSITDTVEDNLQDRENRWLALAMFVIFLALLRAVGAQGLSEFLALVYIMYFVTFWRKQ